MRDSPADGAVKAGDVLMSVNSMDVQESGLEGAIIGPEGSSVELQLMSKAGDTRKVRNLWVGHKGALGDHLSWGETGCVWLGGSHDC